MYLVNEVEFAKRHELEGLRQASDLASTEITSVNAVKSGGLDSRGGQ